MTVASKIRNDLVDDASAAALTVSLFSFRLLV